MNLLRKDADMRLFESVQQLEQMCGSDSRWQLAREAIELAPRLPVGSAYCLGSSVTLWHDSIRHLSEPAFIGKRMYYSVISPLRGEAKVHLADKSVLIRQTVYQDASDEEQFIKGDSSDVRSVILVPGQVLIVETAEAYQIANAGLDNEQVPQADCLLMHITAAGRGLPEGTRSV